MSTTNAKTRQLSLTEVLQEGFTGFSVPSSNSESGDPNEPFKTAKASARRPRKRRQPTGDTPNPQTNKKVNQQTTPPTMDSSTKKTDSILSDPVELSPELKLLETRLQSKFELSINTALEPIQEQLSKLAGTTDEVAQQQIEIKTLKLENNALKKIVTDLQGDYDELKTRLNKLENRSLERNLIFSGIPENRWENDDSRVNTLYRYIANTYEYGTPQEKFAKASSIVIERCKRLGPRDDNRTRPIRVEFASKYDADKLYESRFYMEKGVFIDHEYNKETERARSTLRPILKAAKKIPEYKKKCHLEGAKFILDGKSYSKESLHKLPERISSYNVSTKENDEVVGFFGELSPFSNFHPSPFRYNEQDYHCAKQLIQHEKAKLFGDIETEDKILKARSAIECKQLAYETENYDHNHWISNASRLCKAGIRAKYEQNNSLKKLLLNTGTKKIVECSKDRDWGTGVPLGRFDCLSADKWYSRGILGPLLMEIRSELSSSSIPVVVAPAGDMEVT